MIDMPPASADNDFKSSKDSRNCLHNINPKGNIKPEQGLQWHALFFSHKLAMWSYRGPSMQRTTFSHYKQPCVGCGFGTNSEL